MCLNKQQAITTSSYQDDDYQVMFERASTDK
jgi:hypothetical protein